MRAHSCHWLSTFTGGNCRSQLCIDLRRRIEDGGDIRFEDDCDNRPRHARREPIRLRPRIVKLVLGRTSTSGLLRSRVVFSHESRALMRRRNSLAHDRFTVLGGRSVKLHNQTRRADAPTPRRSHPLRRLALAIECAGSRERCRRVSCNSASRAAHQRRAEAFTPLAC